MPEQAFGIIAFTQPEQFIFARCPQHHAGADHGEKLIAAGVFQHAAQFKIAVHQHTVVIKAIKQRGQAFAGAEQNAFVLHCQAGVFELVKRVPQHFDALAIPRRPDIFLRAVHDANATVAILTVPA